MARHPKPTNGNRSEPASGTEPIPLWAAPQGPLQPPPPPSRTKRWLLAAAIFLMAAWLLFLTTLALR